MELPDFPPRADLLNDIYQSLPKVTAAVDWDALDAESTAVRVVEEFATALSNADKHGMAELFVNDRSYWRDTVAITAHLRTFKSPHTIASVLTELNRQRHISEVSIIPGTAQIVKASDTLVSSPAIAVAMCARIGSDP